MEMIRLHFYYNASEKKYKQEICTIMPFFNQPAHLHAPGLEGFPPPVTDTHSPGLSPSFRSRDQGPLDKASSPRQMPGGAWF
jgi:hypothetical protein